ncbi:TlpA disulfide reductase family protein [Robbsia sp. Bb-Pol-6]|uniref:TlpA disulfide reductase family protein n=1 Tax=Robbsia betulipollinis TaxID=2981849 RepID=A0ABT3ZQQ7_9BURK|nr:TlpA disulfide reductase family protein [Robbsia betulipollinis]MCY0388899.1 TlpA disulfide reductase family protein [Robbsia betulipollinis]
MLMLALSLAGLARIAPAGAAETPALAPAGFFDAPYPQSGGASRSLAGYRGKVVVVNFWASWCGPCVREMPALSALSRQYAARGVRFVGIGVDSDANIAAFLRKVTVAYPVHVAGAGGADLAREMGDTVGGLPYTVLIDATGRIRWTKLGGVDMKQLSAALDDLHPAAR